MSASGQSGLLAIPAVVPAALLSRLCLGRPLCGPVRGSWEILSLQACSKLLLPPPYSISQSFRLCEHFMFLNNVYCVAYVFSVKFMDFSFISFLRRATWLWGFCIACITHFCCSLSVWLTWIQRVFYDTSFLVIDLLVVLFSISERWSGNLGFLTSSRMETSKARGL